MRQLSTIVERFRERFEGTPRVFRAPGRVNLIGEHTDYNDGFAMPAAIEFYCWVASEPRSDRKLCLYSDEFSAGAEIAWLIALEKQHRNQRSIGRTWELVASR